MSFNPDHITQSKLHELRRAAERAWSDETRHEDARGHPQPSAGQCFVTSKWLQSKLGGYVGVKRGHFFWVSPDKKYVIDLTGDQDAYAPVSAPNIPHDEEDEPYDFEPEQKRHRPGPVIYVSADNPAYADFRVRQYPDTERSKLFADQANAALEGGLPPKAAASGTGGDAYPGQTAQAEEDFNNRYFHDPVVDDLNLSMEEPVEEHYNFIYANGEFRVVPEGKADFAKLREEAKVHPEHSGPIAVGRVNVRGRDALWSVETNIGLHGLSKLMQDYTKHMGWEWGGLTDGGGNPVDGDYGAKKSFYYGSRNGQIVLSNQPFWGELGEITVRDHVAHVAEVNPFIKPVLEEWAKDSGYRLAEYPGGTDMNDRIKNKEWPTQYDKGNPEADPGFSFEGEPEGEIRCGTCGLELPDMKDLQVHMRQHETDERIDDGHFPTIEDMDEPLPLRPRNVVPTAIPVMGSWHFEAAGGKEGKDLLQAPIPFIYDIEKDNITVGHPGMKTHDVMGQFTPGGIVEGYYEPKGKMVINTTTSIPFSTYHMMQVWYYSHPGLEITSFEIENQQGERHKVAGTDTDIGAYVKSLVAADGAAFKADQALKEAGGQVYAVGGVIRDALLGKEPKDVDLMVAGLPPEQVNYVLDHLPGKVDLTGARFGVYRYKVKGQEVEISLPRLDTYEEGGTRGKGKITVDHNLPVEEDLQRRDFTANAMAVPLATGALLDPFGGAKDIEAHALRTTHPNSFNEDPTRLVRALIMHSKHGLLPDERTRKEMEEHAYRLDQESPDALKLQLDKLLTSPNPAHGFRLAQETGVLKHLFPELANNFDYDQKNPHHNYSLGEHILHVLSNVSRLTDDKDVRLAALLHDIGKPASAWDHPQTGIRHYYRGEVNGQPIGADHEKVGADMAEQRPQPRLQPHVRSLLQPQGRTAFPAPRWGRSR
jgi:putative nucleotidyltransferase with HDIG domain